MGAGSTRGIGRYTEEIIRAMLELDSGHQYILLERNPDTSPFLGHPSVEHVKADVHWYGLDEQLKLPGIIRATNPEILFVPHWNVPVLNRASRVVFIHDLILLEEPDSANVTTRGPIVAGMKRFGYMVALQNAIIRSKAMLVPTEYVASRIRKYFPRVTHPIVVTGEGMPDPNRELWRDPDLDEPFFITVGSAYPHKNHSTLFEAWKTISARNPNVALKIVGARDVFMKKLEASVQASRIQNIEYLGQRSDDAVRDLLARSLGLIFPSRHEGFGLPPLEALAAGTAVLSSNASCMPEVLGSEGMIYFNPRSPDDIVRAVETVLQNPEGVRGSARNILPRLREKHDWHQSARRTLEAFESVIRPSIHAGSGTQASGIEVS